MISVKEALDSWDLKINPGSNWEFQDLKTYCRSNFTVGFDMEPCSHEEILSWEAFLASPANSFNFLCETRQSKSRAHMHLSWAALVIAKHEEEEKAIFDGEHDSEYAIRHTWLVPPDLISSPLGESFTEVYVKKTASLIRANAEAAKASILRGAKRGIIEDESPLRDNEPLSYVIFDEEASQVADLFFRPSLAALYGALGTEVVLIPTRLLYSVTRNQFRTNSLELGFRFPRTVSDPSRENFILFGESLIAESVEAKDADSDEIKEMISVFSKSMNLSDAVTSARCLAGEAA